MCMVLLLAFLCFVAVISLLFDLCVVALTCGSHKCPDCKTVANGSLSDTLAGLPPGSAGLNGVGKMIMSNTAIGSSAFDVGIVTTSG